MDSYVKKFDGGMSFIGPDATRLLHARTVLMSIRAIQKGMRLTKTATPTRTLALAGAITGKAYKRGQYEAAAHDVKLWIVTMEAALPMIHE
jgi:hypothetical protein